MSPDDLVLRAERLRARVQRDRSAPRAQRDPTGTEPLDLEEPDEPAPHRIAQDEIRPPTPHDSAPSLGDSKRPADAAESVGVLVDPEGTRWALRCWCSRHPESGHDARPLPPVEETPSTG